MPHYASFSSTPMLFKFKAQVKLNCYFSQLFYSLYHPDLPRSSSFDLRTELPSPLERLVVQGSTWQTSSYFLCGPIGRVGWYARWESITYLATHERNDFWVLLTQVLVMLTRTSSALEALERTRSTKVRSRLRHDHLIVEDRGSWLLMFKFPTLFVLVMTSELVHGMVSQKTSRNSS